jgi:hypothetical protein
MLTTLSTFRRTITAMRTRARAARHLGAPWWVVLRAAFGDARAFAATPHRAVPGAHPAPVPHHGSRGVRL